MTRWLGALLLLALTAVWVQMHKEEPRPLSRSSLSAHSDSAKALPLLLKSVKLPAEETGLSKKLDPREMKERITHASQNALKLSQCLRENLCGQGPIGGYFDKRNTPMNGELNRSLRFLKMARETSGITTGYPPVGQLFENFGIPNTETQILSLELILDQGQLSDQLARQIFSVASSVTEDAKPLYFQTMEAATSTSPEEHQELMTTLANSLHNDDINTVADTVAGMSALTLNEDEFGRAVSSLCYIKNSPSLQHNWNEIDSHLIAYHETHAFGHSDPDQICGG